MSVFLQFLVFMWTGSCFIQAFYLPALAPVTYCRAVNEQENCRSKIPVFVNRLNSLSTVLPYAYEKFDLCDADKDRYPVENLGQVVFGDRIKSSPYVLNFKENKKCVKVCEKYYTASDKSAMKKLSFLKQAIGLNYQHHWIVDNMPVTWCYTVENGQQFCSQGFPLGCYVDKKGIPRDFCVVNSAFNELDTYYILNHVDLTVRYHPAESTISGGSMGRILSVKVKPYSIQHDKSSRGEDMCSHSSYNSKVLGINGSSMEDIVIPYTYSVIWEEDTEHLWSSRWDYILEHNGSLSIHWFSIANSLVVIVFLSVLLIVLIKRYLSKDITGYNSIDNIEYEQDLFGWRLVHGGMFHHPRTRMMLAAFNGSGIQLFFTAFLTLVFASIGALSPANRGALFTCALIFFILMGVPAGYFSSRIYKTFGGDRWRLNAVLTSLICPGFVYGFSFVLNLVFWTKDSSAAIPFTTWLALLALWFGVSVPLTVVGAYCGFRKKKDDHVADTSWSIPRTRRQRSCVTSSPAFKILLGGILPFGCIFIELFFILNSIWSHQVYYTFGILFLVFILLIITCSEATVLLCYFHLHKEDYHWWWQSFLTSGVTALYFFCYSVHYCVTKLELQGAVSVFLYVGYSLILAFLLFLLTGAVGFFAWYKFCLKIYKDISKLRTSKLPGLKDPFWTEFDDRQKSQELDSLFEDMKTAGKNVK